ncbi:MAG: type II toxin-antitoxin system RelB/DinJ family antitoxin [Defluviitaleaceae bacterium]|nr:type II toxin-antitoxin system RelB/DinJ family antitoxin [Defluviitaleaceae bacterium]
MLKLIVDNAVNLRYNCVEVIIMANVTYNIRINKEIREEADKLYKSMGMTLSSAINLFLTQSVIQRRLPIKEIYAPTESGYPRHVELALLADAAEMDEAIANGTAKLYNTPKELFATWKEVGDE